MLFLSLLKTDLMRILTIRKVNAFSSGKESYKSTLIFAKKKKKTYAIPLFAPVRYLILLYMESYFSVPNNTKYIVPSKTIIKHLFY